MRTNSSASTNRGGGPSSPFSKLSTKTDKTFVEMDQVGLDENV